MNIGFSLIGTPDGFDSLDAGLSKGLNMGFKVDLDNKSINIFPKTEILYILRERKDNDTFFYFTLYRHAKGIKSNRTGTFYGSTIILKNVKAESNLIWQSLIDMADLVKNNCLTKDDKFNRNISDISSELPDSLKQLQSSVSNIGYQYFKPSNNKIFFKLGNGFNSYTDFITNIFDDELLYDFDIVYVSGNQEVEKDIIKKGLIPVFSFEEITNKRKNNIDILHQKNNNLIFELKNANIMIAKQDTIIKEKQSSISRFQDEVSMMRYQMDNLSKQEDLSKGQKLWRWKRRVLIYIAKILPVCVISSLITYYLTSNSANEAIPTSERKYSNITPLISDVKTIAIIKNEDCYTFLKKENWDMHGTVPEGIGTVSKLVDYYTQQDYKLEGCENELKELIINSNTNDIIQRGNNVGFFKKMKNISQPDLSKIR